MATNLLNNNNNGKQILMGIRPCIKAKEVSIVEILEIKIKLLRVIWMIPLDMFKLAGLKTLKELMEFLKPLLTSNMITALIYSLKRNNLRIINTQQGKV